MSVTSDFTYRDSDIEKVPLRVQAKHLLYQLGLKVGYGLIYLVDKIATLVEYFFTYCLQSTKIVSEIKKWREATAAQWGFETIPTAFNPLAITHRAIKKALFTAGTILVSVIAAKIIGLTLTISIGAAIAAYQSLRQPIRPD